MDSSFTRVCTIVWIVLLVLTVVSGFIAEGLLSPLRLSNQVLAITLLSIAFFKVRLVIMHFMEVGHAALPLRLVLETWVLVTFAVLLNFYFMALAAVQ